MMSVLQETERKDTKRTHGEGRGKVIWRQSRTWSDACAEQGTPGSPASSRSGRETRGSFSLRILCSDQPCQHFDYGLPGTRTVRIWIAVPCKHVGPGRIMKWKDFPNHRDTWMKGIVIYSLSTRRMESSTVHLKHFCPDLRMKEPLETEWPKLPHFKHEAAPEGGLSQDPGAHKGQNLDLNPGLSDSKACVLPASVASSPLTSSF